MAKRKDYSASALIQADANRQLEQQRQQPIGQKPLDIDTPVVPNRANIRGSASTPLAGSSSYIIPQQNINYEPLPQKEDWDYRTAKTNIQGKVPLSIKLGGLEVKPQGYTPQGELYFGEGLTGWFKKLAYQTVETFIGDDVEQEAQRKIISDGFAKLQAVDYGIKTVNPLDQEAVTEEKEKASEEAGNILSGAWDVIRGTWGVISESDSALAVPVKAVNVATKNVIDAFQLVADTTEQVLAMNKTMRRYAEEQGSAMPTLGELQIDPIKVGEEYQLTDELVNTFVRTVNPIFALYDTVRFFSSPGTLKEKTEALKTGWYEGRMLYTELVKPAVEEEYLRRVRAGENPDLLAMELQDPYAELVGELILDPLNFIASGAKVNKFKKLVETSGDLGGVSDEIADVLKAGSTASTPAQISASTDKIADTVYNFGYRTGDDGLEVSKLIGKPEYKATSLNTRGLITQKSKSTSEFVTWISGEVHAKGGTPDDIVDSLDALIKLSSRNKDEIKAGVSYLNNSEMVTSPMVFFGQDALETSHFLRNLMGEGDDVEKLIGKLKVGSWDEQAKLIDDLLKKATKNAYPSVAEMRQAATKIGKLDDVTANLNKLQDLESQLKTASKAELPKLKNQISALKQGLPSNKDLALAKEYAQLAKERPALVTLARFDEEISKPWGKLNSFLSNVYFTNYGFAVRQWISNNFMVFKEGGVNAFFPDGLRGGYKWMDEIDAELAQAFPTGLPFLKPKTIIDSIEVEDNVLTQAFKWFKTQKISPQYWAEATELGASKRVFYKFYRDAMDNATDFGVALPKLEEFTSAGFTVDQANDFRTILRSNGYNVKKATEIFGEQYKNGTELFRDLGWISEDAQKGLREYGGWDALVNFVKNPEVKTREQITDFIESMIDDGARRANQTIHSPNAVSKERALDNIEQFGGNHLESVGYRELQTHVSNAETSAVEAFKADLTNASATARQEILTLSQKVQQGSKLSPDEVQRMTKLNEWLKKTDLHINKADEMYSANGEKLKQLKNDLDAWLSENKQFKYGDAPREAKWQEWYKAVEKAREDYFKFYNGGGAKLQEDFSNLMGAPAEVVFKRSRQATVDVQKAKMIVSGRKGGIFHTPPKGFGYSVVGDNGHDLNVQKLGEYFGVPKRNQLLNTINKYGDKKYTQLFDVSLEDAQKALQEKTGIDVNFVSRLKNQGTFDYQPATVLDDTRGLIPASPIHPGGTAGFNDAYAWKEGQEGLEKAWRYVEQGLLERVGRRGSASTANVQDFQKLIEERIAHAKLTATKVGTQYRDFALHPYGETTNLDHAMQFILPYHFWYTQTYKNFAKSLVTNADMIADYGKIKDAMADLYRDQPEWYKYNIKVPDFFGMNNGNPYMFNLESTIWPLQGITGTDFNNPQKRANWFTATIDDLGKFGPSVWQPINMAIAAYYKSKGDEELSAAWGTRLIGQTALLKSISSYWGTPIELDPNVHLFQQGLDPYEEGRISRALASMELEGKYSPEQLIEAARTHSGEAWEEAYIRATQQRAPGQIMSSLLGVAFRPRTDADMQTDSFYEDYARVRNLHDAGMMSDEDYQQSFNQLRQQYPFMDIILLSRRAGIGRQEAYAYNVISRIPPGMTKEIYEIAGIDPETAQKFYESGGKFEDMSETEQQRFIASMVDIGAMLEIPSNATRQEWTSAKNMYSNMQDQLRQDYGEDVTDMMSLYFGMDDAEQKRLYLDTHPELESALDDQTAYIANNPQLIKFYGGIDTIERYYTSQMYDELEKKYGENITDLESFYYDLYDKGQRRAFLNANPQLKGYWDDKAELKDNVQRQVVQLGNNLPMAELQLTDNVPENPTQEDLQNFAQPAQQITFEQWTGVVGQPTAELIADYWYNGEDLPRQVEQNLDYMANQYGYNNGDDLLQAILLSLPQGVP